MHRALLMLFRQLFDPATSTYTYLLGDSVTGRALLIDPVREHIDRDLGLIEELGLHLAYVLETHVHADHVTSAGLLRQRTGTRTVISRRAGASCADVQIGDGDRIVLGPEVTLEARETPGHTAGCVSYVLTDESMVFTGDTLLIRGCGRTDFQEGNSRLLYRSVHDKLFTLPDGCLVYPGHDYKGRTVSSIGEERKHNPRLGGGRTEEDLVGIMETLNLAPPKRLDESVPANRKCGITSQVA